MHKSEALSTRKLALPVSLGRSGKVSEERLLPKLPGLSPGSQKPQELESEGREVAGGAHSPPRCRGALRPLQARRTLKATPATSWLTTECQARCFCEVSILQVRQQNPTSEVLVCNHKISEGENTNSRQILTAKARFLPVCPLDLLKSPGKQRRECRLARRTG